MESKKTINIQKGFAPIIILILIIGLASVVVSSKYIKPKQAVITATEAPIVQTQSPSPTPTIIRTTVKPTIKPTLKPIATNSSTSVATSAAVSSSAPTPTPIPTPVPTPKATCSVWSDKTASPAPLLVTFAYSASYSSPDYVSRSVTGVQWDFDGDGNWDTDMSYSNARATYTFSAGTYNVKLRLQMSDGFITPTCSKTIHATEI